MLDDAVPFDEDLDAKSIKSEQPKQEKLDLESKEDAVEVKSETMP